MRATVRRSLLMLGALMLTGSAAGQPAWPAGATLRLITPTPTGVGTDTFARIYAEHLAKALGAPVIVENRPGAAGTLGADQVAKAAPNGLTLLFATSLPLSTAPHLLARVPYDAQKDFVPIAPLYRGGSFLLAGPSFPGKTLKDLIDAARSQPGTLNYASYGPGSTAHLGMERFQDAAGIRLVHIPYKQSAMPDLVGGQIAIGFEPPNSALPYIRSGKVTALAYTGDVRSSVLPNVPTLAETLPGLSVSTAVGVWAPAGTPDTVQRRLHAAFSAITQEPEVEKAILNAGSEPMKGTSTQMAAELERESKAMRDLIQAKQITVK